MSDSFRIRPKNVVLSLLTAGCFMLMSAGAGAAPVEGCDPKILLAQQAVAMARVAADKAIDDEINGDMPSSVLALTCFDQAAAMSAKLAGSTFTGSFLDNPGFKSVMNDALKSMETNFADSIVGKQGLYPMQAVESYATAKFNCDTISKLWGNVNNAGVKTMVPYPTFDDMMNGAAGAPVDPTDTTGTRSAGPNYQQSWASPESKATFTDMNTKVSAVVTVAIPSFANLNTPCQVLKQVNPAVTCPP